MLFCWVPNAREWKLVIYSGAMPLNLQGEPYKPQYREPPLRGRLALVVVLLFVERSNNRTELPKKASLDLPYSMPFQTYPSPKPSS